MSSYQSLNLNEDVINSWESFFNEKAMAMLDILEWVPFNFYERKSFEVISNGETFLEVQSYVTCYPKCDLVPSRGYLDFMIQAGIKAGVPDQYIDELRLNTTAVKFNFDPGFNLRNPSKRRPFTHKLSRIYLVHDKLREKLAGFLP